jgi:hypothetical protein
MWQIFRLSDVFPRGCGDLSGRRRSLSLFEKLLGLLNAEAREDAKKRKIPRLTAAVVALVRFVGLDSFQSAGSRSFCSTSVWVHHCEPGTGHGRDVRWYKCRQQCRGVIKTSPSQRMGRSSLVQPAITARTRSCPPSAWRARLDKHGNVDIHLLPLLAHDLAQC